MTNLESRLGRGSAVLLVVALFCAVLAGTRPAAADHQGNVDPTVEVYSRCSSYEADAVAGHGVNITNHSAAHPMVYTATLPFGEASWELPPASGTQHIRQSTVQSLPEMEVVVEMTWPGHTDGADHHESARLRTPAIDCPRPADESHAISTAPEDWYYSPAEPGGTGDTPPIAQVATLAGASRIQTAVAISQDRFDTADIVVIATGYNFPDALAATPLAALNDAPILLTGSGTLHPSTAEEIRRLNATQAWLLGGTSALSDTVVGQLNALGVDTRRLAGAERIGTALAIADQVVVDSPPTEVWLVTSTDFPDALTAGPSAGRTGQPLLLTGPDTLPDAVAGS